MRHSAPAERIAAHLRIALLVLALVIAPPAARASPVASGTADPHARPLLVFAAASLTDALRAVGAAYTHETGEPLTFSFAASSTLARQIQAGARARVFFSADTDWMDYLERRHLIAPRTRRDIVSNRLALIAPAGSRTSLTIGRGLDLAGALGATGRLSLAEPDSVPAGRYAREALRSLGAWQSVAGRLIPAENVRSALEYVARGEAPLGIVYETDALIEPRVRIVGLFPPDSHAPIEYPAAVVASAGADERVAPTSASDAPSDAARFVLFLASPAARSIFHKYGFGAP